MTATADLVLRRCRVDGHPRLVDVTVVGGVITGVGPDLMADGAVDIDVAGRLTGPAFVQPHIHLDKVGVATLLEPNRSGTLAEAISLLHRIKRMASPEDTARRAGEVIRWAVLSGTTFIRSHVDVDTIGGLAPLHGVLRAAREHADLCDVEIVAFPQEGLVRDPGAAEIMAEAMHQGATVVGGMPHWERDPAAARQHIELCMDLARRHESAVDMHIDETDDAGSRTFEMLLDATQRYGWEGRVTAGHCCAMAGWEPSYLAEQLKRAADLDVAVVINAATNLMLQGRSDPPPQRRGLPPVKDVIEAGVRVAAGQDCVADTFYPFGTANQLQVALILCHAAQLSTPAAVADALAMIGRGAAEIVGLGGYGVAAGCRADIVVLDADNGADALRHQAACRWVVRGGRVVAQTTVTSGLQRAGADR